MRRWAVGLAVLLVGVGQVEGGILPYTIADLGNFVRPSAINNRGVVTGAYFPSGHIGTGDSRVFIYDGLEIHDLGTLGGNEGTGYGINDNAHVVGYSYTTGNAAIHAFFYDGVNMMDLGTFGGSQSYAHAINNVGQIAGSADVPAGEAHAFLYEGGNMIDLGILGLPGGRTRGLGMNEHGHVVGGANVRLSESTYTYRAFVHDGTTMVDILGLYSKAYDINDHGDVVGTYTTPDHEPRSFLYQNDSMTDLGTFGGSTTAWAINDHGHVVGYSELYPPGDHPHRAFVYDGSDLIDLNTVSNASQTDWVLRYAYDINDRGQIVGIGLHNGEERAFLLTPIPEPCALITWFVLGALGIAVGWWRRRR